MKNLKTKKQTMLKVCRSSRPQAKSSTTHWKNLEKRKAKDKKSLQTFQALSQTLQHTEAWESNKALEKIGLQACKALQNIVATGLPGLGGLQRPCTGLPGLGSNLRLQKPSTTQAYQVFELACWKSGCREQQVRIDNNKNASFSYVISSRERKWHELLWGRAFSFCELLM